MSAPDVNAAVLGESGGRSPLMITTRSSGCFSTDARDWSIEVSCEIRVLFRLFSRDALRIVIVANVPSLRAPDEAGTELMSQDISPFADGVGGSEDT